MTDTYYVVQTAPTAFLHGSHGCYEERLGRKNAARLSISEARRLWRGYCDMATADVPLRFPRILKITEQMKTITPKRRK